MTLLSLSSSVTWCPLSRCSPRFRSCKRYRRIRNSGGGSDQNVIVLRHADRLDNFDPDWVKKAERPWDPPLFDAGFVRAFSTGCQFRPDRLGFRIHRIFVSPFLRCIQTASEVATSISAPDTKKGEVMVSIEYGLCEMFNRIAIRQEYAPRDWNFQFDISKLEGLLPAGTVDHTYKRIYEELPQWEESKDEARKRYEHVIQELADKYPTENLLLVTHGEGVGTSVASFLKGGVAEQIDYCAYSHGKRGVLLGECNSHEPTRFELVTLSGIKYYTTKLRV